MNHRLGATYTGDGCHGHPTRPLSLLRPHSFVEKSVDIVAIIPLVEGTEKISGTTVAHSSDLDMVAELEVGFGVHVCEKV